METNGSDNPGIGPDWGALLATHRGRLRRMVTLRLDRRLRGRIDPSDVIQEAYLEATGRRDDYEQQDDPMPPFLWLRFLVLQQLQIAYRKQLGTKARDVGREVSMHAVAPQGTTSAALAERLLGRESRASEAAIRAERKRRLQESLDAMDPVDREILALRHFEQLTNRECAQVLGLNESAATKRHLRALARLKDTLSAMPGGSRENWI